MPVVPGVPGAGLPVDPMVAMARRIQELERVQREMLPAVMAVVGPAISDLQTQQATLTSQQAQLTSTVNDLAARVSQTATIASFNTGSLPNDNTFHTYGPGIPITIAVPTGKIVVSVGCGQATVNSGTGGAVIGEATFTISGGYANLGDVYARDYVTSVDSVSSLAGGASLYVQQAFSVTPGTYTITGQMMAWSSGATDGSVQFSKPFLTVQVTG